MEAKLVNNQFAQKEDIVICPYNSVHTVPASRIQYHLQKCRLDKSNNITPEMQELVTCPFNAKHKFLAAEKAFHYRICGDRTPVERHIHGGNLVKGQTSIPGSAHIFYPPSREDWEDTSTNDESWGPAGAPPIQPSNVGSNRDASSGLAEAEEGDRRVRRPATESNAMRFAKGMEPRTTPTANERSQPKKGRPDTRGLHPIDAAKQWVMAPVSALSEELQATIAYNYTEEDVEDMEDEYLSNNMASSGVGRGQGPPPGSLLAAGSPAPVGRRDPPLGIPASPGIGRQPPLGVPASLGFARQPPLGVPASPGIARLSPTGPPQQGAATSVSPGSIALKKVASAKTVPQPAAQATPPVQPAPLAAPPVQPAPQPTPDLQSSRQIPQRLPPAQTVGTASNSVAPPPPQSADSGQPAAIVRPLPASASDAQPRRPRPLGRAAPQPPLGASASQPGIPARVQTPPPDFQDNSSAPQESVIEPQLGYPEPQQGFAESQQGFLERQPLLPKPQRGFPEPQQGLAESQQGFLERQPLLPKPQRGFPEPQHGFSQQGVQPGVPGIPLSQQGGFWPWSTTEMAAALPGGRGVNVRPPPGFGSVPQGAQPAVPATIPASSFSPAPSSTFSPISNSAFSPIPNSAFSPIPNSAFSSTSASSYSSVPSSVQNPAVGPMYGPGPSPTPMHNYPLMSSHGKDSSSAYGHAPSPAFHSPPSAAFPQAPSPASHQAPSPAFHQAPSPAFHQAPGYGHVSRPGRPRAPGSFNPGSYGPSGSGYNAGHRPTYAPPVVNRAPGARGPALLPNPAPAPLSPPMQAAGRGAPGFPPRQVEMGGMGRGLSFPGPAGPGGLLNPYPPWNNQFPPGSDQGGQ